MESLWPEKEWTMELDRTSQILMSLSLPAVAKNFLSEEIATERTGPVWQLEGESFLPPLVINFFPVSISPFDFSQLIFS